ncbi:hypothetical protein [Nonomuraea recticatena]|uniref:DUF4129 domain-containing protein n=1 Tax=Nonomuraea recticatena TaxID=46178 RepID=A0ABN3TE26_9ACTN
MAMTLPQELTWLASVTGATAIFLWDEDALAGPNGLATHLHTFLNQVAPGVHETNAAAARYAAAASGAESDAFPQHWNAFTASTEPGDAGSGDTGGTTDPLQIAGWAVVLFGLAAGGVILFKTGVLARLAWCAQQMAASAAAGPGGALTAAQAVATIRAANAVTSRQLRQHLEEKLALILRRYSALLHGRRPALDGQDGYGKLPTPAKGGDRADMGRRRDEIREEQELAAWRQQKADNNANDGYPEAAEQSQRMADLHQKMADDLRRLDEQEGM